MKGAYVGYVTSGSSQRCPQPSAISQVSNFRFSTVGVSFRKIFDFILRSMEGNFCRGHEGRCERAESELEQ